jgi:manganese oxidase
VIFNENQGKDDKNERGLIHAANGDIFGSLPGLAMNRGGKVRWHVLGTGNEIDLHTIE